MRFIIFVLCAAIAACAPQGGRCDITVTQDVAFTAPDAQERITTHAFGESCDRAIALYAIHDAEGYPVWSWSTPLARAFGEAFVQSDDDHMRDFLTRWGQPSVSTTQSAPEWERLAPGQTTLGRLTYDDIRARDLPMLCHASGTAREVCVFWEPVAGGAGLYFERDVEEAE